MPHPPPPPPHQPPHQPPQQPPLYSSKFPDFLLTTLSLFLFITTRHPHLTPRATTTTTTTTTTHRRFLRLISQPMSQNPNPNPNFSPLFPTPQSLYNWLKPRIPFDSFASWGTKPGTKNIHNLWLELEFGETSLIDDFPPIRNLEVVCVRIFNKDGNFLIESKQELSDGSFRVRNRPLSEKLKSGEGIENGVKRAIKEELGSVIRQDFDNVVKVKMDTYERRVEERNSVSYPGLPACYVLHNVDVFVEGLPEGEFVTEEGCEYDGSDDLGGVANEAVGVKRHFWKWVDSGFEGDC